MQFGPFIVVVISITVVCWGCIAVNAVAQDWEKFINRDLTKIILFFLPFPLLYWASVYAARDWEIESNQISKIQELTFKNTKRQIACFNNGDGTIETFDVTKHFGIVLPINAEVQRVIYKRTYVGLVADPRIIYTWF